MNRKRITVLGILLALLLVILGSCAAISANASGRYKALAPIQSIVKDVGCKKDLKVSYDYEDQNNYRSFTCRDKNGRNAYGENYVNQHEQDMDLYFYEGLPDIGFVDIWLAQCDGFNVWLSERGDGSRWVHNFAERTPGCTALHMDGAIHQRKAGLPG